MDTNSLIPVITKYADLLGIGLSEGTAIIVSGDKFEVVGAWKVVIHDNTRQYQPWEKPYFVLSAGDVYNMKTRVVERYVTAGNHPLTAELYRNLQSRPLHHRPAAANRNLS